MRDRSPVETVLTYATFMALSLAVHIAVILGNRPLDLGTAGVEGAERAQTAQTAQGIAEDRSAPPRSSEGARESTIPGEAAAPSDRRHTWVESTEHVK